LKRLTRKLFQGSPELLLTHLVSDQELSEEDARRLRGLLDEWSREQFEELGPEVNVLEDEQLDEFAEATEEVYDIWAPEIGEDLVDDVLEMVRD
jgi:TRAP-type transport system periplasmic protein